MLNNFFGFVLFFVLVFFSKEFFYFDEEFIVVISFFIVFTALFQFSKSVVYSELEARSNQIFENFQKFYTVKANLINHLEEYYKKRNKYLLNKFLILLNNVIFLLNKLILNKLISLVYNINRILANSLGNVIVLENKYLKENMLGISLLGSDRDKFFFICEDILNNMNQKNILQKDDNFKNFF